MDRKGKKVHKKMKNSRFVPFNQKNKYIDRIDDLVDKLYPPRDCEWTNLCEQIWRKFEENEQTASDVNNKISVWEYLSNHIEVLTFL